MYEQAEPVRSPVSGPGSGRTTAPPPQSPTVHLNVPRERARYCKGATGKREVDQETSDTYEEAEAVNRGATYTSADRMYTGAATVRQDVYSFIRSHRICMTAATVVVLVAMGFFIMFFINNKEISQLSITVNDLNRDLESVSLRDILNEQNQTVAKGSLLGMIKMQASRALSLQSVLEQLQADMLQLQADDKAIQAEMQQLRHDTATKDQEFQTEIGQLQTEMATKDQMYQAEIQQLHAKDQEMEAEIQQIQNEMAAKDQMHQADIQQLQTEMGAKDQRIQDLEQRDYIERCESGVFETPDDVFTSGDGDRHLDLTATFSRAFRTTPVVTVGLTSLDHFPGHTRAKATVVSVSTTSLTVKVKGVSGLPVRGVCIPNDEKVVEQKCHGGQVEDCYLTCRQKIGQKGETSPPEEGVSVTITNGERRYCSVPGKTGSRPSRLLYRECGETVGGEGMNSVRNNRTCGTPVEDKQGEAHKTPQKMLERVLERLDALEESRRLTESKKTEMEEQILRLKEEAIRKVEESAKTLTEQVRLVFYKWEQDVKNEIEDLTSHLKSCHGNGRHNYDVTKSQLDFNLQRHAPKPPVLEFVPSDFEGSVFTLGRIEVKKDKEANSLRQDVLSTLSRTFTSWKSRFGTSGTKKGQFSEPLCVTTASDHVYVIDRAGGGRVQVFTLKGEQVSEFMLNFGDNLNINGCGLFSDGRHVTFVGSLCKGAIGVDTTYTNVFLKYTKEGRLVARRALTVGSSRDPIIDASGFQDGRIAAALTGKVCILATSGDTQSKFDTTVQTYKRVCVDHRNNNILLSLHKTVQVSAEVCAGAHSQKFKVGFGRGGQRPGAGPWCEIRVGSGHEDCGMVYRRLWYTRSVTDGVRVAVSGVGLCRQRAETAGHMVDVVG
uniref:H-type lectin domain-containing protein n=1 Tax=Branchiostoma floridae TaxID=7739 RepID=C3XSX6_BRAFL|eukprot:XP_002612835.1 hypothetical protein BRAFLDRAFT_67217 [Branchiostoma floridae]